MIARRKWSDYAAEQYTQPSLIDPEYLAAKAVREQGFLFWPLVMIAGALAGYESELRHALNAKTVYLGPGR